MGKVFVTSDQHFWHSNIIKFENRPFETVEQMNEKLIAMWNETVTDEDTVYILGDFSFAGVAKTEAIVKQLNGRKHLIVGNHDSRWLKKLGEATPLYFESVQDYLEIKHNGYWFAMMHYPIASWNGRSHGSIHLYGHIHSNSHTLPKGFNRDDSYHVGVDTNHYKPVDLDWIIKIKEMAKEPEKYIPKNTCYCYDENGGCPFSDYAENRGSQNNGVCHFMNTTDFELNKQYNHEPVIMGDNSEMIIAEEYWEQFPTSLLWDGCKECCINDDCGEDDYE